MSVDVVSYPLGAAFYDKGGECWFRFTIDRANRIERPATDADKEAHPEALKAYQVVVQPTEAEFVPNEGYETLNVAADTVAGMAAEQETESGERTLDDYSKEELQELLASRGVQVDGRWGEEKLRDMARG